MADEKKKPDGKKKPEGAGGMNLRNEVIALLVATPLIGAVVHRLMSVWVSGEGVWVGSVWDYIWVFILSIWPFWKVVAVFLTVAAIGTAIYTYFKLEQIESKEENLFGKAPDDVFLEGEAKEVEKENPKWSRIFELGNSNSPSDWRLAILEADILLEEALRAAGFMGESIGEILKSLERSDLLTLENAWEAHKVRNRIAHSGQGYDLTERETRRVLSLFESVFRELRVI